jgi:hypothetical protein
MAPTCPQAAPRAPGPTASSWAPSPGTGQFAGLHTEVARGRGRRRLPRRGQGRHPMDGRIAAIRAVPAQMSCYMAGHDRPRPHIERHQALPRHGHEPDGARRRVPDLARGETLALTGESGSGKSTLLHLAGGLDAPDAGHVRLMGHDLSTLSDGARARIRGGMRGWCSSSSTSSRRSPWPPMSRFRRG